MVTRINSPCVSSRFWSIILILSEKGFDGKPPSYTLIINKPSVIYTSLASPTFAHFCRLSPPPETTTSRNDIRRPRSFLIHLARSIFIWQVLSYFYKFHSLRRLFRHFHCTFLCLLLCSVHSSGQWPGSCCYARNYVPHVGTEYCSCRTFLIDISLFLNSSIQFRPVLSGMSKMPSSAPMPYQHSTWPIAQPL